MLQSRLGVNSTCPCVLPHLLTVLYVSRHCTQFALCYYIVPFTTSVHIGVGNQGKSGSSSIHSSMIFSMSTLNRGQVQGRSGTWLGSKVTRESQGKYTLASWQAKALPSCWSCALGSRHGDAPSHTHSSCTGTFWQRHRSGLHYAGWR